MTHEAQLWLPEDALTPERVEAAMGDMIREWSGRWLGERECTLALRSENGKTLSSPGEEIKLEGSAVTATLWGRGKRVLLEGALDMRLPGDMSADDHALLDAFMRQVIGDLTSTCDRGLTGHSGTSGRYVTLILMLAGVEICKLACNRQALIGRTRAQLGAPTSGSVPLTDRRVALGPMSIQLESILGGVDLTLEDLENLATGDVLILDRDLDSPIPVRIRASQMDVGFGTLGHRDSRPTITF